VNNGALPGSNDARGSRRQRAVARRGPTRNRPMGSRRRSRSSSSSSSCNNSSSNRQIPSKPCSTAAGCVRRRRELRYLPRACVRWRDLSHSCLPFAKGELALHAALAEVEPRRDEGEALLLGQPFELADLGAMQQQLAGAQRLVIHRVAMRERADVCVQQKALAVFEQAVSVLEVRLPFANRLHLSPHAARRRPRTGRRARSCGWPHG